MAFSLKSLAWVLALGAAFAGGAAADTAFPQRPIRLVVPYTPGGTTDLLARRVGEGMSTQLGQPVVVENRPGAGTAIAADHVARSQPDGYTMLVASNATLAVNDHLGRPLTYAPLKSFDHVTLLAAVPNVIVVRNDAPYRDLADLIAASKRSGSGVSMGSMGAGTSTHIGIEVIRHLAGAKLVHVPYKGSAPALTDLLSGHVDAVVDTLVATLPQIQAGKLRPLAVFSAKRSTAAPQVPTVAESGLQDVDLDSWFGLVVPKGTPAPVIAALHRSAVAALQRPDTRAALESVGVEVTGSTSEDFAQFAARQHALYGKLIKAYGLDLN